MVDRPASKTSIGLASVPIPNEVPVGKSMKLSLYWRVPLSRQRQIMNRYGYSGRNSRYFQVDQINNSLTLLSHKVVGCTCLAHYSPYQLSSSLPFHLPSHKLRLISSSNLKETWCAMEVPPEDRLAGVQRWYHLASEA